MLMVDLLDIYIYRVMLYEEEEFFFFIVDYWYSIMKFLFFVVVKFRYFIRKFVFGRISRGCDIFIVIIFNEDLKGL